MTRMLCAHVANSGESGSVLHPEYRPEIFRDHLRGHVVYVYAFIMCDRL